MCPTSVTVNCAGYVAWKHKNTVVFIGLWRWAEQTKHATHAKMLYRILHAALLELFVRWNPISGIYSGERGRKDTRKRTTKFISSPSTANIQTHLKTLKKGWWKCSIESFPGLGVTSSSCWMGWLGRSPESAEAFNPFQTSYKKDWICKTP